jgi:GntR family transcriptional regulator/MocR family aminotransferase
MNAFDQLPAEGYIRGEAGSGTFVEAALLPDRWQPRRGKSGHPIIPKDVMSREAARIGRARYMPASAPPIPFRRGLPALDEFPLALWSQIVTRCCRKTKSGDLNYTEPQGSFAFRCTVAEYLRNFRAVKCEPEQILIVSGSQQGLQLIAHTLLNEGDPVCMEDPGYPGARSAFLAVGANVLPVPIDDEGIEINKAARLHRIPKLIYVTPSHQFPLGVTMSLRRRMSLLNWAEQSAVCVVEDDYDSNLWRYNSGTHVNNAFAGVVVNGNLYIVSGDGNLYTFHLPCCGELKQPAPERPGSKSLRPDLNLKVPSSVATGKMN